MPEFRSIEIDFDVHKRIEIERRSFSETPNDVLRRLLGLDPTPSGENAGEFRGQGRAWSGKGIVLPHGTQLRMEYNGRQFFGEIVDGDWVVEGARYSSPSGAATGVARTRSGKSVSLDGWGYWEAKRRGDEKWISLRLLRREA